MKTNAERAEEVLKRASANESTKKTAKEGAKRPKQKLSKKWIAAISSTLAAVLVVMGLGLGLGLGYNFGFVSLDKKYLANFSSYSALGAGSQSATDSNTVLADSNSDLQSGSYLLSVLKDGNVTRALYADSQNGKGKKIPMYVHNIAFYENYTIVDFSSSDFVSSGDGFNLTGPLSNEKHVTYVLDNRTGRFYSLKSLFHSSNPYDWVSIYTNETLDGGDCFFFYESGDDGDTGIYKAYVENNDLVVKQVFKGDPNRVFDTAYRGSQSERMFADRYGNVCFWLSDTGICDPETYYLIYHDAQSGEDKLSRLNDGWNFSRSINGEIYCEEQGKRIDENGKVVDAEFCDSLFFRQSQLIKHDEGVDYYYQVEKGKTYDGYSYKDAGVITKITWQDDTRFSTEEFKLEKYDKFYASTKDYLYFCGNQKIYRVKIADGTLDETYAPDAQYFFMSITPDNLGRVSFTALDSSQNTVVGKIDNDGNIDITVNPNEFKVYYIKPL